MSENLGILIALAAGVLSFLSPCILPLIPSYLSLVGGISVRDLGEGGRVRSRVLLRTALFVLGFSVVFILLGVLFSGTGGFLVGAAQIVNIVAGALVIVLGLNFIFNFWKFLNFEKKLHLPRAPGGYLGAALLGMAFGAGWTPCVGPILASILFLAGTSGRILEGTMLLAAYSLGLGLPFLLAGLFFSQFLKQRERLKSHFAALKVGSGVFLVLIGLLIALGRLQRFNIFLFRLASSIGAWRQASPWQARILFGGLFLIPALLLALSYLRSVHSAGRWRLLPARLGLGVAFLLLAVLTLAGLIDPTGVVSLWLTYQGI